MVLGVKLPFREHAHATISVMLHALEKSKAFSIALKLISHGAFCVEQFSPLKADAICEDSLWHSPKLSPESCCTPISKWSCLAHPTTRYHPLERFAKRDRP